MLELCITIVLTVHLLCMNLAAAGPLICVWLDWRQRAGDRLAGEAGRFLACSALLTLLVGSGLGIALGGLLWDDAYLAVLRRLPTKIRGGIAELVFSLLLLAIYAGWWKLAPAAGRLARILRSILAVLLATNLLYHFPILFGVISHLDALQEVDGGTIDAAAFRQRLLEGYVLSRSIHFVLASVAVTGVALIAYAAWRRRTDADDPATAGPATAGPATARLETAALARAGGWIAFVPSLAQIPVGLWVLTQLPDPAKRQLMGNDLLGTTLLLVSVLAALWLMHLLSSVAFAPSPPRRWWMAVAATLLVVLLMTAMARRARPPTDSVNRLNQPTHLRLAIFHGGSSGYSGGEGKVREFLTAVESTKLDFTGRAAIVGPGIGLVGGHARWPKGILCNL